MTATAERVPAAPLTADLGKRAEDLLQREIAFVPNREFLTQELEAAPLDFLPESEDESTSGGAGLPVHLVRLCTTELLTADQERTLFRRMNFLKCRANQCRSRLDPDAPEEAAIERIESLLEEATSIRDHLIKSNMRLVISIARKYVTPQSSFDDLLSDGAMALMYAVDKFDFDRGFRFSTYAYRAISRSLYRSVVSRRKEIGQLGTFDLRVADSLEDRSRSELSDQQEQQQRELLTRFVGQLSRRERFIVRARSALGSHRKKRTCRELAERLGISKERVRQIEIGAIAKIKEMAASTVGEQPA